MISIDIDNLIFFDIWLVVEPNPSEKWWSESQLGWLFYSQLNGKSWNSMVPVTTNQIFIDIKVDIGHCHSIRFYWFGWSKPLKHGLSLVFGQFPRTWGPQHSTKWQSYPMVKIVISPKKNRPFYRHLPFSYTPESMLPSGNQTWHENHWQKSLSSVLFALKPPKMGVS